MDNREILKNLLVDVFLLAPEEFHFGLMRDQVDTWDSLGVVSLAVGIEETFGYHFTADEALAITGVPGIIELLETKGISFNA